MRDLLWLKEIAWEVLDSAEVLADGRAAVGRSELADLARCLETLRAHGEAEGAWRLGSEGQISSVTLKPQYGPRQHGGL